MTYQLGSPRSPARLADSLRHRGLARCGGRHARGAPVSLLIIDSAFAEDERLRPYAGTTAMITLSDQVPTAGSEEEKEEEKEEPGPLRLTLTRPDSAADGAPRAA